MNMKSIPIEWNYISDIRQIVQRHKSDTIIGLGDDAFVTASPQQPLVMAQDMMIEEVHFELSLSSAADLGHKSLAINLSDFAAMGATPRWAQVSLGISEKQNKSWLDEFYRSMTALADRFGVEIVGGDLCHSPKALVIDVSVVGSSEKPISRSGARAGDLLLCSGPLGLSAKGLEDLRRLGKSDFLTMSAARHLRPTPRLDLLKQLQEKALCIHALIDVSDGLISECLHLTRNTELGLDLHVDHILRNCTDDVDEEVAEISQALWGGEDYELLMAIAPSDLDSFLDWQVIGEFNQGGEIALLDGRGVREIVREFKGWKHF